MAGRKTGIKGAGSSALSSEVGAGVSLEVAVGVLVGAPGSGVLVGAPGSGVLVGAPGSGVLVGAPGSGVDVRVDVGPGSATQTSETALSAIVTAPVCANARPLRLAPLFSVIDVSARTFPMKVVAVSRVAELPTLHHTLQGSPPVTLELGEVMTVDADLKIQTPTPERVKLPLSAKAVAQ